MSNEPMNSPDSLALAPLEFGGSKRTSRALENSLKLGEYLSRQLHFRTQTILEGLKKLANYESRTYYFQKYSSPPGKCQICVETRTVRGDRSGDP